MFKKSEKPTYLKYIGFFDSANSTIQRSYTTSAANKMEYIAGAIAAGGQPIEIISTSSVTEPKLKLYKHELKQLSENILLRLPLSWGGRNKYLNKLKTFWHVTYLFLYLIWNTHRGEPIIVYHSLGYFSVILWAKKLRHFKLILETEEIYSDVSDYAYRKRKLEYKMFKAADAFLFSTQLLNEKLNTENKPCCVNYGTYHVEKQIAQKYDDGKIHVVYAGTFDPRKGGAAAAAAAAEYLPANYHLHICGFGSKKDVENILQVINSTAVKSKATISYDGLLKGRDFIRFIQRCHIGLSTQNPDAAFNATSFPSKILTYMANGLSVVSIDIKAIKESSVGPYIHFYKSQTPKDIAKAIASCDTNNENRKVIETLNTQFTKEVREVLHQL